MAAVAEWVTHQLCSDARRLSSVTGPGVLFRAAGRTRHVCWASCCWPSEQQAVFSASERTEPLPGT